MTVMAWLWHSYDHAVVVDARKRWNGPAQQAARAKHNIELKLNVTAYEQHHGQESEHLHNTVIGEDSVDIR
jgi:hypothetical protein